MQSDLYKYLLRLADTNVVLSHRLAENCSNGPYLEEDLAISNTALDLLGAGEQFLIYAAEISNEDVTADDLAYRRNETEYFNFQLVEQPNTDFAYIYARQFYMDVYNYFLYEALSKSTDERIAAIAVKSLKEVTYHLRKSSEWIIRLGDGTAESHERIQTALNDLWFYTNELFEMDQVFQTMKDQGIGADLSEVKNKWLARVSDIITEATLSMPQSDFFASGGVNGVHTEYLGYILAEMQYLPRAYPDAKW